MPVLISQVSVIIVALIHALISISEIFLWKKPAVHERIGFNQVDADKAALNCSATANTQQTTQ